MESNNELINEKKVDLESPDHTEEIIQQIHAVLGQIFTKEFLDSDPLVQSQINNVPLSLPTSAVYQCSKILSITDQEALIKQALETSNSIILTENLIRPNIKIEQNTVILREVEEDVTESSIREMFHNASCPPIVSCRSEANNYWFIVFGSEVDARVALEKIKNSSLGGKTVRARLKTESLIRRTSSGNKNPSPTFRTPPPTLDIEDPTATPNASNQTPPNQSSHAYFYPPMMPMMSPNLSPNQLSGSPPFPPHMPGVYYMYPPMPNGFIPHPMHPPMGSPMYMWPPYPMMQMSPNVNGNTNQPGRGKSKQLKSPRNQQQQQQQPYYRNQNQNRPFREKNSQGADSIPPQMENLPSPHGETRDPSRKEQQQYENYGAKKKAPKKKKDRGIDSTSGPGDAQSDEIRPRERGEEQQQGVPEERKRREPTTTHPQHYQNGKPHSQNDNNNNFSGAKGGGRGRDPRTSKSSATGKGLNTAPPPKPEHKFNLDADFPSLHNTASSAPAHSVPPTTGTGISWAARISKAPSADSAPTAAPEEPNISFGNVPSMLSSSPHSSESVILPSHSSQASVKNSAPHAGPGHTAPSSFAKDPMVLMTSSHGHVEYPPISFGAFEAAPVAPESGPVIKFNGTPTPTASAAAAAAPSTTK